MALGTPTAAAVAYSAASGTSVSPAYPTGLAADDVIVMFIGQKPTTANGGTVTTPTGWTLRDSLTAAGGYGTTTGADVGNTNLFVYTKDTVTGSETGTLSVTVGDNNVCWAFMIRVPVGNGTISYGTADGQRTTTPTSPMSIALANGASATAFQTGDLALWAMCIPTDVTTPSQFSAQSITATGATFGTAVEFNEPDSTTGNDIGGYSAYASVSSGSSSTAPTVTTTLAGTLTNVRGPVVLLRVRETAPPSQSLAPSLYTNTNTIYSATVTQFAPDQTLTQAARFNNVNALYSATVNRGPRTLSPALYTNTNTFYSATVGRGTITLQPQRYSNTNFFFAPTVSQSAPSQNIAPAKYTNTNTFYSATITKGVYPLTPAKYTNTNTFYSPLVTKGQVVLAPPKVVNVNVFYSATISKRSTLAPAKYTNTNLFFPAQISLGNVYLQPAKVVNVNTFYSPIVSQGAITIAPNKYTNQNTIYSATVSIQQISSGNMMMLFFP